MDCPLTARPYDMYTVNVLIRGGPGERGRKPLDLMAGGDQSASHLMSQDLCSASLGMTGTAPVEDEDAHA
jgi:hypothetical protein